MKISSCLEPPTSHHPPMDLTLSHMSVRLRCTCVDKQHGALLCWDLLVGIQDYNHFVSVVGLVKAAIAPREELAAGSDLPR